jgi:hypothetical protein
LRWSGWSGVCDEKFCAKRRAEKEILMLREFRQLCLENVFADTELWVMSGQCHREPRFHGQVLKLPRESLAVRSIEDRFCD